MSKFKPQLAPPTTTTRRPKPPKTASVKAAVAVSSADVTTTSTESLTVDQSTAAPSTGDSDFEEIKKQLEMTMQKESISEVSPDSDVAERDPENVLAEMVPETDSQKSTTSGTISSDDSEFEEMKKQLEMTMKEEVTGDGDLAEVKKQLESVMEEMMDQGIIMDDQTKELVEMIMKEEEISTTTENLSQKINDVFLSGDADFNLFSERDISLRINNSNNIESNEKDPSKADEAKTFEDLSMTQPLLNGTSNTTTKSISENSIKAEDE